MLYQKLCSLVPRLNGSGTELYGAPMVYMYVIFVYSNHSGHIKIFNATAAKHYTPCLRMGTPYRCGRIFFLDEVST